MRSRPIGRATRRRARLFTGTRVFRTYDVGELVPYIDWTPFFQTWEMRGRYPAILDDEKQGEAARQLFDDAQAMLERVVEERWFDPEGRHRLLAGERVGEDIELYTGESRRKRSRRSSPCASNCRGATAGPISRLPISSRRWTAAKPDYIGAFVVTAGRGRDKISETIRQGE